MVVKQKKAILQWWPKTKKSTWNVYWAYEFALHKV